METGTGVTESLLTGAESTEVGGGLGDNVVEQLESDLAGGGTVDGDIEEDLAVERRYGAVHQERERRSGWFWVRHVCSDQSHPKVGKIFPER